MKQIAISLQETAHWHAMIGRAEYSSQHVLPPCVENYLVRLLLRFENEASIDWLKAAHYDESQSMEQRLNNLGEHCLLLCTFYPDVAKQYNVDLNELITIGSDAYNTLANMQSDDELFSYLGSHFPNIVDMLSRIQKYHYYSAKKQAVTNRKLANNVAAKLQLNGINPAYLKTLN